MEIFKEETDIDSKQQIFKLESSDLKKEFPDTTKVLKCETNATVNDKLNDFGTEHGKKSDKSDYKLFIKKECTCGNPPKYDYDESKSSCKIESSEVVLTSETSRNSVVKNSNIFSCHPQSFENCKTHGYNYKDHVEPNKFYLDPFSQNVDFKNQNNRVRKEIKDDIEMSAHEIANSGYLTKNSEHVKNKIKYICEHCRRAYLQKGTLNRHLDTHIHGRKKYKCSLCLHGFSRNEHLKKHIDSVHNKIKEHKCSLCSYKSSVRSSLKSHTNSVHNKMKEHNCNLCSYKCSLKSDLKRHVDSVHNKIKEHKCKLCSYECSLKQHLKRHIDSVHNKIKENKCNLCSYECSMKKHLKRHIDSVHYKIKEHKCNLCSYECSSKSKLKLHIDSVHNNIKFKCSICSSDFSNKSNLKRHVVRKHKIAQHK